MQFPMLHHDAFAAHAPAVPSCQLGPHLAGHRSNSKLISATFIAYHFATQVESIFINILLLYRNQKQQIVFHTLKQRPETHIRANYTDLLQKWDGKLKRWIKKTESDSKNTKTLFASLCNEMYNLLRQSQT